MANYLFRASYTVDGVRGLLKDGGSRRREVARDLVESAGGRLESFHFAFGETDVFFIADMPDHAAAAAVSLAVGAAAGATCDITVLLTPEELDGASKKIVRYTPPGR